jgi:hypothetical protein
MVTATITKMIDNEGEAPSLCIPHRYPGKVSPAARDMARVRRREAELEGAFMKIIVLARELLSVSGTLASDEEAVRADVTSNDDVQRLFALAQHSY